MKMHTYILTLCFPFVLACQPDERLPPGYLCEQDSDCDGFCLHRELESYCSVACAYGCYDNCDEHNDPEFLMVCEASAQSENGWACVAHPWDYNVPDMSSSCFDPTASDPTASDPTRSDCCAVCVDSKPCGDSCITYESTCHVGPGCACA